MQITDLVLKMTEERVYGSGNTMRVDDLLLSDKERLFVDAYLINLNASEAARKLGQSEASAQEAGRRILERPHVQAAISFLTKKRSKAMELTAERVLEEYQAIAFSDLGSYLTRDERGVMIVDLSKIAPGSDASRALATVMQDEVVEGRDKMTVRKTKITLHDKMKALDFLSRYLGMDGPTKIELSGPNGQPVKVEQSLGIDLDLLSVEELEALNAIAEKLKAAKSA